MSQRIRSESTRLDLESHRLCFNLATKYGVSVARAASILIHAGYASMTGSKHAESVIAASLDYLKRHKQCKDNGIL